MTEKSEIDKQLENPNLSKSEREVLLRLKEMGFKRWL